MMGSQWRQYRNERWGFCAEVPKGWQVDEGIDGAGGAFFLPDSKAGSSVTVGALPNDCVDEHDPYGMHCDRQKTLQEIESEELAALKTYSKAADIKTISSKAEQFQGLSALRTRLSYAENGKPVIDEMLRFIKAGNMYAIEFQCSPSEVKSCEAASRHIEESFRFQCR